MELCIEWCIIVTWHNSPWDWSQLDDMTSTKKLYSKISHDKEFDSVEWRFSFNDFKKCRVDLPKQVNNNWHPYDYLSYEVIWLPPTLPRVLQALGSNWAYVEEYAELKRLSHMDMREWREEGNEWIIKRKLLNSNKTDATLFDQDQSTQDAIALLLWWK